MADLAAFFQETTKMTAKFFNLEHARNRRERRKMLEAAAEEDLVLASLLLQNHPILSDLVFQPPKAEGEPTSPEPPSEGE